MVKEDLQGGDGIRGGLEFVPPCEHLGEFVDSDGLFAPPTDSLPTPEGVRSHHVSA